MTEERMVAGILCSQVLSRLDAFVADDLSSDERAQIEAHLKGCTWCEEFGGRYISTVTLLKTAMSGDTESSMAVIERALGAARGEE